MSKVLHGQGAQLLRHIPVDRGGRPRVVDSATYEIVDLRYSEDSPDRPIGSGPANVGTVNTLLTAAAGPLQTDQNLVPVTSASGIATGRPFLLVGPDAQYELVSVAAISSLNIYTHFDLRQDFTTAASLRSVEITASFPDTEADDEVEIEAAPHGYQITWNYTIDSELYIVPQTVWIERTRVVPIITELDLLRAFPTIGPRLRNRADLADAIAVATDDYAAEVLATGRSPESFRGNETARVAVRARALEYCFRWCGASERDVAEAERFRSQYNYLMNQLLAGVPRPGVVTVNPVTNTGSQDTQSAHPLFVRR